jgi:REP element-mobilizing transposase RayT
MTKALRYTVMRRSKQRVLGFGRLSLDRHRGGRPRGPRPIVLHRRRKAFLADHPCHVTLKVRAGLSSLRLPAVVREIEATFRRASSRKDFRLVHYSIQDDHAHLIIEANGTAALGRGMKSLASRFAFAVNRALGRTGKVLAERYHLRVMKCLRQVRNTLAYVLLNKRRHAAKRIARLERSGVKVASLTRSGAGLDAASSARWFDGWRRDIAVDRSPPQPLGVAPAVASPRTWFLREGWRRYGPLDPNDIPGRLEA